MTTVSIPLHNRNHPGLFAIIDEEDFEHVSRHEWRAMVLPDATYAVRDEGPKKARRCVYMHREIMDAPQGVQVDHWDRNGLNNRRANLRACGQSQNNANQGLRSNNQSGYKGVSWHSQNGYWRARIQHNGKGIYIGVFDSAEDAARAYDAKARELQGDFALVNFP